jgi:hypothetical protein
MRLLTQHYNISDFLAVPLYRITRHGPTKAAMTCLGHHVTNRSWAEVE